MRYPMVLLVALQMMLIAWLGIPQLRQVTHDTVFTRLRTTLCERYRELGIAPDECATLEALTLGYREDLSRETKQSFQAAGAMHVLAVSGLHTGLLYGVLLWLLTIGGRRRPLYEDRWGMTLLHGTLIVLMFAYAALTGMSPSVCRSVAMIAVMSIGVIFRREAENLNTLAVAAFVILLFRPGDMYSLGFQLSFLAVAALILTRPTNIVTVSLAAQLGTLPLCLHCFGQISNYFLLTNLIVLPLASGMMALALAFFTIGWIPGLGTILAHALGLLTWLMNSAVWWIESLPGSVTHVRITTAEMLCLYAAILSGVMTMRRSLYWLIPATTSVGLFLYLFLC